MPTKEVTVSGAVGKQVYATSTKVILKSVILTAVSAANVVIRDGNASGTVVLDASVGAALSDQFDLGRERFDKGMHVKVTGTNSKCYLVIE